MHKRESISCHVLHCLCTYCPHQVKRWPLGVRERWGRIAFSRSTRHTAVHFVPADVLILCRPGSTLRPRGGVRLQLHRHVLAGTGSALLHGTCHVWRAWRCLQPPRRVSRPQTKAQILDWGGWAGGKHRKIIYRLPAYSHLTPLTHTGALVRRGWDSNFWTSKVIPTQKPLQIHKCAELSCF